MSLNISASRMVTRVNNFQKKQIKRTALKHIKAIPKAYRKHIKGMSETS